jgi:hypothetical protein
MDPLAFVFERERERASLCVFVIRHSSPPSADGEDSNS